ncbi:hypothetical protein CN317_23945 [Bacillus cereus]|nr:hypothetical protein CN317_23945 [Bacillus cereus]
MKLTLFTISNEQIKEQLSKLQTKVESLENVKDVQDKIISAKDSQISFLEGQISTISTWVSIAGAAAGIIASLAFAYVTYLNRQAQKKVEQGEEQIAAAQIKINEADSILKEAEKQIEAANLVIIQSQTSATTAQEKIDELNIKQKDLQNLADSIDLKQKVDMRLNRIKITLETIEKSQSSILKQYTGDGYKLNEDNSLKLQKYMTERHQLNYKYNILYTIITQLIVEGASIGDKEESDISSLQEECNNLFGNYFRFEDALNPNQI